MTRSEISFSLRNLPVRAFNSRAQGFSPPLARQRSSCPPPSPNLVRTHLIENHQALRDSAPCLSRAATLPKATKLELGRGAHLKTPSSANHTAAASQPTGRIAKAASWLHLSRVSPALLPPERPSHTHTPKPGFGGRGHEIASIRGPNHRQQIHHYRLFFYFLYSPALVLILFPPFVPIAILSEKEIAETFAVRVNFAVH